MRTLPSCFLPHGNLTPHSAIYRAINVEKFKLDLTYLHSE